VISGGFGSVPVSLLWFAQVVPLQSDLEFHLFRAMLIQPVKCFSLRLSQLCFQVILPIQRHPFLTGSIIKFVLANLGFKLMEQWPIPTEEFYTFKFG